MQFKKRGNDDFRLDVTPLVDCVFLLLIFFMLSSTLISISGIKVNLPESSAEKIEKEKKEIKISITKDGKIYLNKKETDLKKLASKLKEMHITNRNGVVIIHADKMVSHGRVVEVMDIAKTAGFNKLAIATEPKKKKILKK
ncbi:MAG: biopolymer transporter ExbD [Deltaproteobacteria bacterium]|nr:biopolymer transporter ExbD [Deltaproteobacteria bacterium]RLA89200.1 MAG: biopolymer transporter ExbD [Deltaproteobacteria bacterium]